MTEITKITDFLRVHNQPLLIFQTVNTKHSKHYFQSSSHTILTLSGSLINSTTKNHTDIFRELGTTQYYRTTGNALINTFWKKISNQTILMNQVKLKNQKN